MKKPIILILTLVAILAFFLFVGKNEILKSEPITDINDLEGRKVGVLLGWGPDYLLSSREDMELMRYNSLDTLVTALCFRKIDALSVERPMIPPILENTTGLRYIDEALITDGTTCLISASREDLLNEFNAFIAEFIKSEEYADILRRCEDMNGFEPADVPTLEDGKVIEVCVVDDSFPFSYIDFETGEIRGSDVEILLWFAYHNGYTVEMSHGNWEAMDLGVCNEIYDMGFGCVSDLYRDDYESTGLCFVSDVYMEIDIMLVEIEDAEALGFTNAEGLYEEENLLTNLADSFYLTFILENRWLFFVDGLWTTLLLTSASFILGSMLGAMLCALKLSKNGVIRKITNAFVSFLIQLPTVVLLMIFVYVLFGSLPISVLIVVIFGLTLKVSAYMCDIFHTAITNVNRKEIEAAYTLGMTPFQVFFHITLPQSIDTALPLYKNQFVITLQETSVVGYLAIMDLTRASEVVTSRTMDAIFGLIVISILYLLIGFVGNGLLSILGYRKHIGEDKK